MSAECHRGDPAGSRRITRRVSLRRLRRLARRGARSLELKSVGNRGDVGRNTRVGGGRLMVTTVQSKYGARPHTTLCSAD